MRAPDAMSGGGVAAAADRVREGVPDGSLRQLAVLFSRAPQRQVIEALYAFEAELRRVVGGASHEAAHARLQWWRGEVDRLAAGRPSHPVAQALLPLRDQPDVDLHGLHEMLVAADLDLAGMTYRTWRELEAYLVRASGTPQALIAAASAGSRGCSAAERQFAHRLGAAVRQVEILCDLEQDLARGRMYAPTEALAAAGVDPAGFTRDPHSPAAVAFLDGWKHRVGCELAALPALLGEPALRAAQRHGLVLAALHARWLDGWPADASSPGLVRTELGPLTRLWTAWRAALRHP